uniref:Putative gamma-glutamylcyclotransferase n=1 Tax=Ananas comosus var. bracteatus TaxID=296719 RepID=A0A6V7PA02_ANACO|nr:unnamed protein product [Ananas comosus var. bracteatus]
MLRRSSCHGVVILNRFVVVSASLSPQRLRLREPLSRRGRPCPPQSSPPSSPASLNGYHRFSIKGRVYPAILPVESKKVTGKVLMGITDPELVVLDTFEDVEYLRRTVEISLIDSSETLLADTYVWGNQDDPDLYGDWDFEEWKRLHMKDFLAMTKGFMEELEQPESKTRVATYESFFQK